MSYFYVWVVIIFCLFVYIYMKEYELAPDLVCRNEQYCLGNKFIG